jgi:hypothetical protein
VKVKNIYVTGRHKLRYTVYTGKGKRAGEYNQLQKSPDPSRASRRVGEEQPAGSSDLMEPAFNWLFFRIYWFDFRTSAVCSDQMRAIAERGARRR